jgi:hypothetical protein
VSATLTQRLAPLETVSDRPALVSWLRRPLRVGFGGMTLWMSLAVLAAVPLVNLLVLGYFLEVEGRLARGGRLKDAFPFFDELPRLGGALVLTWLWLLPVRLLANAAADQAWISPSHGAALSIVRWVIAGIVAVHLVVVWVRGARTGYFLRPWSSAGWLVQRARGAAEAEPWNTASLQAGKWARSGALAAASAVVWLLPPVALMVLARASPGHPALGLVGVIVLVPVLATVPFLQARFAAEGSWRALFEWRAARAVAGAAPGSAALAVIALYVLTLPLYLLKIVLPPADAMWIATAVFVATIFPMRIWVAKAYARGARRGRLAHPAWRWCCRLVLVPLLAAYAGLLFLTPLIDSHGPAGLLAQHALLLPAPF